MRISDWSSDVCSSDLPHHDLDALTDEVFRRTFDVNVFGTWWLTKAAIPHLKRSDDGNVVTITSLAGVRPVGSSIRSEERHVGTEGVSTCRSRLSACH